MDRITFDEAWNELENESEETKQDFIVAGEISRIIVELINIRNERGYTQRQLAMICGIKQAAIARMESLRTIPRLDTVIRVANALGVVITLTHAPAQITNMSKSAGSLKGGHRDSANVR